MPGFVDYIGFQSRLSGMGGLIGSWEPGNGKGIITTPYQTGIIYNSSAVAGTVTTTSGSPTVTGTNTNFTTTFVLGDQIIITGGDTLTILSIASDTSLTATTNALTTVTSGGTYKRKTIKCSMIYDLSGNANHFTQGRLQSQPIWTTNGLIIGTGMGLDCFSVQANGFLNGASGLSIVYKGTPGTGSLNKFILSCSQSSGTSNVRAGFAISGSNSNKFYTNCYPQGTGVAGTTHLGTTGITTGVLQVCVMTYDCASDTLKFYRGSTLDTTTTSIMGNTGNIPSTSPLVMHLGSDTTLAAPNTYAQQFSVGTSSNVGYLSEVHVFNRALSSTEVGTL